MYDIVTTIYDLFSRFGYSAIFAGVMLDNAGFPVPGELILLITGSMVASGEFSYLPTVLVAASGALLWAASGVWLGDQFAAQFSQVAEHLDNVRALVIYLTGAGLLLFFLIKLLVRHRHGRAVIEIKTQENGG